MAADDTVSSQGGVAGKKPSSREEMLDAGTRPWRFPRWDDSEGKEKSGANVLRGAGKPKAATSLPETAASSPSDDSTAASAPVLPEKPAGQSALAMSQTKKTDRERSSREQELHDGRAGRSAPAQSPRELALAIARSQAAKSSSEANKTSADQQAGEQNLSSRNGNPVATASEVEEVDVPLPTADELNKIRELAAEEGRQQGLEQGRQLGHDEGFQQGFEKGHAEGLTSGLTEGRASGLEEGRAQGLKQTLNTLNQSLDRLAALSGLLQQTLLERDAAMPEVLASLVVGACEQVLKQNLAIGHTNIEAFIASAMERLPDGEDQNVRIQISPEDLVALRELQGRQLQGRELQEQAAELVQRPELDDLQPNPALKPGEVHIESAHTQVDYRVFDHLQQLLEQLAPTLLKSAPGTEQLHEKIEQEIATYTETQWQSQEDTELDETSAEQQAETRGQITDEITDETTGDITADPEVTAPESELPDEQESELTDGQEPPESMIEADTEKTDHDPE